MPVTDSDPDRILSTTELGRLAGRNNATVIRWHRDGCPDGKGNVVKLRLVRVGGRLGATRAAFDAFVAALNRET